VLNQDLALQIGDSDLVAVNDGRVSAMDRPSLVL
jgi:hypothetical protein